MQGKTDPRSARSERAIKDALLEIMAHKRFTDITVTEVAREAHVSRNTFYQHFGSTDDVYDAVVRDLDDEVLTITENFDANTTAHGRPMCALLREDRHSQPAMHDSRFVENVTRAYDGPAFKSFANGFAGSSLTPTQIKALYMFQMSGCYMVACSEFGASDDWPEIREALDRFIAAGMRSLL